MLLFETFIQRNQDTIDPILDKMSKSGKNSLTAMERRILKAASNDDWTTIDMISRIKKRVHRLKEFDPRNDDELKDMIQGIADITGSDPTPITDEDVEDSFYNIVWDELEDHEMKWFTDDNSMGAAAAAITTVPWHKLSHALHSIFKNWVDKNILA